MNGISEIWHHLRSSLWFVPTLIVLASMAAAVGLVEAHGWLGTDLPQRWPRLFGASAEGSRAMLSAVATSMITVAGVVFSITIVALSLTSTQYSPRVLRNFMRDRPTQVVLGVFVGVFAYCLIVLRTIRGSDYGNFVPSLAVLAGMGYAFAGIALLIYFIHHVAQSIQAASILARIHDDTAAAIDRLFPEEIGHSPAGEPSQIPGLPGSWTVVKSERTGYVTSVDGASTLEYAVEKDRVLRLVAATGDFIVEGGPLLELGGPEAVDRKDAQRLRGWVSIARQRTVEQDGAFGLQQLVDVALKALSPGINDPTTACMCIDQLGALLVRLASRDMPDRHRMAEGRLRVIAPAPDFACMLAQAFDAVLQHSRGDVQVLGRLLDALATVGAATQDRRRQLDLAKVTRSVYGELQRIEPRIRSVLLRRQARTLERGLRQGVRPSSRPASIPCPAAGG